MCPVGESLHLSTGYCSCWMYLWGSNWCLVDREPGRLASVSAHSEWLSLWWCLLQSAAVREYLVAFCPSFHSPEFSFPVFQFCHWGWLAAASVVFSQELVWILTMENSHRGGELHTDSLGKGADWLKDMAFLACWVTRSFSLHISASQHSTENVDRTCFLIFQHNLSTLLHIRRHCQNTVISISLCKCWDVEKDPRQDPVPLWPSWG